MTGIRTFLIIWSGQLVSIIGSGLRGFSLGVWIFQRTASFSQFALIVLCDTLPAILVTPLAGVIIDRCDRRKVMIASLVVSTALTGSLAALLMLGQLQTWNIAVAMVIGSVAGTFHRLAYSASMSLIIPKQHLVRANAMIQVGLATGQILSPLLAGVLLETIHLQGVLVLDGLSYLVALGALLLVTIPRPSDGDAESKPRRAFVPEFLQGWQFIVSRPGLVRLMVFITAVLVCGGFARVLLVPLILGLTTVKIAGVVSSVGGVGLLLGGVMTTIWGGPKRRVHGLLGFGLLFGICLVVAGFNTSIWLIGAAVFGIMFGIPIIASSSQAIWQTKTPSHLQGRVFAVRTTMVMLANPLAYVSAGQLADKVFEPMLAPGGLLATTVGSVIGVGKGRGVGLMLILTGLVVGGLSISGYLYAPLRLVEDELPDMVKEPASTAGDVMAVAAAGRASVNQ